MAANTPSSLVHSQAAGSQPATCFIQPDVQSYCLQKGPCEKTELTVWSGQTDQMGTPNEPDGAVRRAEQAAERHHPMAGNRQSTRFRKPDLPGQSRSAALQPATGSYLKRKGSVKQKRSKS